ncbi:hypothetical protein [Buttiauxella ferragutiae]|uniref:hypothetical protein n=1 Tax=Buttiauxella ferragutiae TaxID=82989 RepID=UPI001F53BB19|nr:hypothetical protein [Buttiauxella ferragutiae]UNK63171.1 hypothetical protein MNO13_09770 [Buttiauxella ferragutiae]
MLNKIFYFIFFICFIHSGIAISNASSCNSNGCEGLSIPSEAKKIINSGYEYVSIENYLGNKYLVATTVSEINKCSVLFGINGDTINNVPTVGVNNQICNLSMHDNKIISSWRDAGEWNEDIYQINTGGKWKLLFRDSCVGCEQTKRTYFLDDKKTDTILLSGGDDFTKRKELIGQVTVNKAILFKSADLDSITKSYLIKGDNVTLTDMSKNGAFYKIKYKTGSGKFIEYWMKSEDFDLQ